MTWTNKEQQWYEMEGRLVFKVSIGNNIPNKKAGLQAWVTAIRLQQQKLKVKYENQLSESIGVTNFLFYSASKGSLDINQSLVVDL